MVFIWIVHLTFEKIILFYKNGDVIELSKNKEKIIKDVWRMEKELGEVLCFQNLFLSIKITLALNFFLLSSLL